MASYKVDYNDERFTNVTNEKNAELNANDQMYQEMIDSVDTKYNGLQADLDANRAEQEKLLQEQTDFTIDKIEQDRANAQKDYLKEQSGAYVDWQKESNKYGANAEQMAASGLTNSGFHESTQVSIYNTYQNRLATARESMVRADQDFTNQIKEAQLQNSSLLAQIASDTLQQKLQLTLEAFQYKNNLITEKANTRRNILSYYDSKWENVLDQINTENALAEEQRQFDESLIEDQRQFGILHGENTYTVKDDESAEYPGAKTIQTDYFKGTLPSSTQLSIKYFGTFANGYQPKGIPGHGYLTKSGETVDVRTTTLSGEKRTVTQNVWKADDGSLWYWEGREMVYKSYGSSSSSTKTNSKNISYTPTTTSTTKPYLS